MVLLGALKTQMRDTERVPGFLELDVCTEACFNLPTHVLILINLYP